MVDRSGDTRPKPLHLAFSQAAKLMERVVLRASVRNTECPKNDIRKTIYRPDVSVASEKI